MVRFIEIGFVLNFFCDFPYVELFQGVLKYCGLTWVIEEIPTTGELLATLLPFLRMNINFISGLYCIANF